MGGGRRPNMQMSEFEKRVKELLTYYDDDGDWWVEDSLKMHNDADGCLSASFRGKPILCEGCAWEDALDIIVGHIERCVADGPAGHHAPVS